MIRIPLKTQIPLLKKLLLIFLSLAIGLLMLEIILRLAGIIYLAQRDLLLKRHLQDEPSIRVMCVGESTTAMGGKNSYPRQLQDILDQRHPGAFQIINRGIPSIDSADIKNNINDWIEQDKPHAVILMMGINDPAEYIPISSRSFQQRLSSAFNRIRVIKLFRWILRGSRMRLNNSLRANKSSVHDENTSSVTSNIPEEDIQKLLPVLANQQNKRYQYGAATVYKEQGDYAAAKAILNESLKGPVDANYLAFAHRLFLEIALAENNMEDIARYVQLLLTNKEYLFYVYRFLAPVCQTEKHASAVLPILIENEKSNDKSFFIYDLLSQCSETLGQHQTARDYRLASFVHKRSNINTFTRENYRDIVKILISKKISIIVMQYPLRSIEPLWMMLQDIDGIENASFLENVDNFEEQLHAVGYDGLFKDRFGGDFGHGTALGNRVVAENAARSLEKTFSFVL